MTRAAPARLLGLADRGHLGAGAAADIAVYREDADRERMFRDAALRLQGRRRGRARGRHRRHADRRHALRAAGLRHGHRPARCKSFFDDHMTVGFDAFPAVAAASSPLPACACSRMPAGRGRAHEPQRRRHRRHLRRGLPDEGDAPRHHRRHAPRWARIAAVSATGFATSVIGCGCEAGIERELAPAETPDGRPGHRRAALRDVGQGAGQAGARRVGQCVLTCPAPRAMPASPAATQVPLGRGLRFFGDGWQTAKLIGGMRYWRIPGDGRRVRLRGYGRRAEGGRRRQLPDARPRTDAGVLAAAERAVAAMQQLPERDHAVSRRRGALGLEGRLALQVPAAPRPTIAFCPTLKGARRDGARRPTSPACWRS